MNIKICCIKTKKDLSIALAEGVNCVGFVSRMPSGPGIITEHTIRELVRYAPNDVNTFLLTSERCVKRIIQQWAYCRTTTIQLCFPFKADELLRLKANICEVNITPVVHVNSRSAIVVAQKLLEVNDSVLLDSGDPTAAPPQLGGTGRTHDWTTSRRIRECWPAKTLWLAGGLTPSNVRDAVTAVKPTGVDVCSGVRTHDRLDPSKLREFLIQVKNSHAT